MTDPGSPPGGRTVGGGGAPGLTRGKQVAERRLPAPEDGQPGERRRLTPDAPHRAYQPWGQCWAPYAHTRAHSTWTAGPGSPVEEGSWRLESARPWTPLTTVAGHQGTAAPHHPRGTQPPQGVQAKGTVLGPHGRTTTATAQGRTVGGGRRLTSDAPHNGERCPPPGTPFRHPHSAQRRPAGAHAMG